MGRLLTRPIVCGILLAGTLLPGGGAFCAEMRRVTTGSIVGTVQDAAGLAQMGATVLLLNRYDRPVMRALTNERGQFGFDSLAPDFYAVKVLLTSFIPALKSNIQVQAGRSSILSIQLNNLLSSIELRYAAPGHQQLMSEEWKWVLRSSVSTRPVLRFLPGYDGQAGDPTARRSESSVFSDTHGLVRLSAGDSAGTASYANQQDLGTAFAMATSLYGNNHVGVSGNVGFNPSNGVPTAGFRTSFRRGNPNDLTPEVNLTVRQLFLPGRVGAGLLQNSGAPALRSMSISVAEKKQIMDDLLLEYGFALDSVTFVERLNYVSPYARLSYDMGDLGSVELGFNSGAPPVDLMTRRHDGASPELQQQINALGMFPRVSLRDGHTQIQRAENYEIGYRRRVKSTTFSGAGYREAISNGALTMAGADGFLPGSNLLPDLNSTSSIFNVGGFRRTGFIASVTQEFNDYLSATLSAGQGGVLRTESRGLLTNDPGELRSVIRRSQQPFVAIRFQGTIPGMGTRFSTSYQWTDYRSLTPGHWFLTQRIYPEAGLNLSLRQPVPLMRGVPGRMEINAEARNMLAQGYLPLDTPLGRRLLLIHTPRALRGGISFIF